jgi:hypothetical protein
MEEMGMNFPNGKTLNMIFFGAAVTFGLLLFIAVSKDRTPYIHLEDTFRNILNKNETLSQMRSYLYQSLEMEKNAVMARTDEESQKFVAPWLASAAAVDEKLKDLHSLVEASAMQDEKKLVVEFDTCWTELRRLDQTILQFTGQNTNLKAADLSRGRGAEVVQKFQSALLAVIEASAGAPNESQVVRYCYRAFAALFKIYALHSPHIAEASDEKMDEIEARMNTENNEISNFLNELSGAVGQAQLDSLLQAKEAFAEFMEVTAEMIVLSRKNSNIKSLELSLGRKRKVAAQCDEILAAFLETVHNRSFKASR